MVEAHATALNWTVTFLSIHVAKTDFSDTEPASEEPPKLLCLPYVKGLSEKSVHPTWSQSNLQTHEDHETDSDESEDPHPRRKEKSRSV